MDRVESLTARVQSAPLRNLKAKLPDDTIHKLRVLASLEGVTLQTFLGLIITAQIDQLWRARGLDRIKGDGN